MSYTCPNCTYGGCEHHFDDESIQGQRVRRLTWMLVATIAVYGVHLSVDLLYLFPRTDAFLLGWWSPYAVGTAATAILMLCIAVILAGIEVHRRRERRRRFKEKYFSTHSYALY